jgi:hypothetical protein
MIEVTLHGPHPLEHRRARRRLKAADNDIADFTLGMTADHR